MIKSTFKTLLTIFSKRFFIVIMCFLLIRLIEFGWFQFELHQVVPWELFFSKSVNLDIQYLGLVSLIGFIPFSIIFLINTRIANVFNLIWNLILILIQISLTQYHLTNQTLLTSVVFKFTPAEIMNIVGAEMNESNSFIFSIWLTVFVVSSVLLIKVKQHQEPKKLIFPLISFILIVNTLINIPYIYRSTHQFDSRRDFIFANSKPVFIYKSYQPIWDDRYIKLNEIIPDIKDFHDNNKKHYSQMEYPLIYDFKANNVLGPYFQKSSKQPNIVLIISESLSSNFSVIANGFNGQSLTPFTDSLAENGLYWSKFLSNAPRSFGALPNILASIPPSLEERGIINHKNKDGYISYPDHLSLIHVLKENNYNTSYFNPGWSGFDNTNTYVKYLGIDDFMDQSDFDTNVYQRYGGWGFSDYELYMKGLDHFDELKNKKPQFSLFQTVAFHHPFDMVEPKYYKKEYLDKRISDLKLTHRNILKLSPELTSSIFASDEALKSLFERYKKNDSYDNTIFIITGDHALDIRLTDNPLEKYHVPLIIYSPLLAESKKFEGLSSHIDITPSLLALLKGNFGLQLNKYAHWLGEGLDTSSAPSYNSTFPMQINDQIEPNYINKEHIVFGDRVYRLLPDFSMVLEENENKITEVKQNFEIFKKLNIYTTDNNKIWSYDQ